MKFFPTPAFRDVPQPMDWQDRSRVRTYYRSHPRAVAVAAGAKSPDCKCGACEPCIARAVVKEIDGGAA